MEIIVENFEQILSNNAASQKLPDFVTKKYVEFKSSYDYHLS